MGEVRVSPHDDRVEPVLAKVVSISHVRIDVFAWDDTCHMGPNKSADLARAGVGQHRCAQHPGART